MPSWSLGMASTRGITGKVVRVSDGDTLTAFVQRDQSLEQIKVRVSGIDASEKAQAFGNRSKQGLSDCAFAKQVRVEVTRLDRYGRSAFESGGKNVLSKCKVSKMEPKSERDVEKAYPSADFVAKLRRLADAIENGERFEIQIAGERIYVPVRATFSIEHEKSDGKEEVEFQIKWERE